ncbi:hypothetical protein HPP92_005837 [Vanilla planifolia]|uniref:Uncharacterized protein n=1 Tax=Vanilla planifolia TaxID=51239 RepID=A0A835RJ97_VANPL|nr:hypothetical protein HPP92_005837 [Vanilla planifolia]
MGSKRSSSKNPNKDPSPPLPPPTEAPADGTNPKKRSVASPSKPLKKTKPLVSMSGNPDVACPVASPEGEDPLGKAVSSARPASLLKRSHRVPLLHLPAKVPHQFTQLLHVGEMSIP